MVPTVTGVFICSLVGYIFAKKDFRGKNLVFWYFMAAIMIPFQALMVSSTIFTDGSIPTPCFWCPECGRSCTCS